MKLIKLTISRKTKPDFSVYFRSVEDCRAFTEFEQELVENVKKKAIP